MFSSRTFSEYGSLATSNFSWSESRRKTSYSLPETSRVAFAPNESLMGSGYPVTAGLTRFGQPLKRRADRRSAGAGRDSLRARWRHSRGSIVSLASALAWQSPSRPAGPRPKPRTPLASSLRGRAATSRSPASRRGTGSTHLTDQVPCSRTRVPGHQLRPARNDRVAPCRSHDLA